MEALQTRGRFYPHPHPRPPPPGAIKAWAGGGRSRARLGASMEVVSLECCNDHAKRMISRSFIGAIIRLVIWGLLIGLNDFNDLRARTRVFVAASIHVDLDGHRGRRLRLACEKLDHSRPYLRWLIICEELLGDFDSVCFEEFALFS